MLLYKTVMVKLKYSPIRVHVAAMMQACKVKLHVTRRFMIYFSNWYFTRLLRKSYIDLNYVNEYQENDQVSLYSAVVRNQYCFQATCKQITMKTHPGR